MLRPDKRWNIPELIKKYGEHVYRDYEGFHEEEEAEFVKTIVTQFTENLYFQDEQGNWNTEVIEALRDIVANLLLEQMEHDEDHSIIHPIWGDRAMILVDAVYAMLTVTEWTKSKVDWKQYEGRR